MTNKPILSGESLDDAARTVNEIRGALSNDFRDSWYPANSSEEERSILRSTLAHGLAGWAVFNAYYYLTTGDRDALADAVALIERSVESANELPVRASFFEGLAGIAWVIAHFAKLGIDVSHLEIGEEVDEYLVEVLAESTEYPEVAGGAAGIGIYALERFPSGESPRILREVERVLRDTATHEDGRVSWFVGPEMLWARNRKKAKNGYWDLGLAHGNAGIALLVATMIERGAASPDAVELLRGNIRFIQNQRLPNGAASSFPSIVLPDLPQQEPSRLGWCYGDLGIAVLFLRAAAILDDPSLASAGKQLASRGAAREAREAAVVDAGLCHGSAGVAHILSSLTEFDPALRAPARQWLESALKMRGSDGVAGFSFSYDAVDYDGSIPHEWISNPGLLQGAAGIGLALMSGISTVPPAWNRFLLLS